MLERNEFFMFLKSLKAAIGRFAPEVEDPAVLEEWFDAFKGYDKEILYESRKVARDNLQQFPSIAELKGICETVFNRKRPQIIGQHSQSLCKMCGYTGLITAKKGIPTKEQEFEWKTTRLPGHDPRETYSFRCTKCNAFSRIYSAVKNYPLWDDRLYSAFDLRVAIV